MPIPLSSLADAIASQAAQAEAHAALAERVAAEVVTAIQGAAQGLDLTIHFALDLRGFLQLGKRAKRAVLIGCQRAAKPVRAAVVANAEAMSRTGNLARSIGTKTKVFGGGTFTTVIGPKMSYSRTLPGKISRGPRKGQSRKVYPYLYSNVLESPKSGKRFKSFLGPAWRAQSAGYMSRVQAEITAEIAKITG